MIPLSPLRIRHGLLLGALALASALPCQAQITVQLRSEKRELVAFEPLRMEVAITNNSGRSILLARAGGQDDAWLAFHVTRDNGDMLQPSGGLDGIPPLVLNPGQSIARTLDIGLLYPMSDFGGYVVQAQVWCPPDNAWGTSNNVRVNVVSARTLWTQSFGVPKDKPGSGTSRTFKLQQLREYDGSKLYVRLEDRASGTVLACYGIGAVMEMHAPTSGVDSRGNLHVLFKSDPSLSAHVVVDCAGNLVGRTLYRDVTGNRPSLERDSTGGLVVLGGRPFDPVADTQMKLIVRRLSERPPGLLALINEARNTARAKPAAEAPVPPQKPTQR